jgi:hypothetical protein
VTYLLSQAASGAGTVNIDLGASVSGGQRVVATITDASNNTSEFSNAATVTP